MSINTKAINTEVINNFTEDTGVTVVTTGVGNYLTVEQITVVTGVGNFLTIEQTTEFRVTGVGNFLTIEQDVLCKGVGNYLTLEQMTYSSNVTDVLAAIGWYPVIHINNTRIPEEQICGNIDISFGENEAAQCTFTLRNPNGVQNYYQYVGKTVTITILYANGDAPRMYTGKINVPNMDFVKKRTTYTCTDLRKEQIIAQMPNVVPLIGHYSEDVFGKSADIAEELEKRLTTTLQTVDFDAYGNYMISDYMPKASADISFTDGDLLRKEGSYPTVKYTERSKIVNKITINMTYQFTRKYQREMSFTWSAAYPSVCAFLTWGYSICAKQTILNAIQSAGWPLRQIGWTPILDGGWYTCGGGRIAFVNGKFTSGDVVRRQDDDGNSVTDNNGNPVQEVVNAGQNISSQYYAFGAQWIAATRFLQNLQEEYTFTITAPQSNNTYPTIEKTESVTINNTDDNSAWEKFDSYQSPPSGATHVGRDYYIDVDNNRQRLQKAFDTIVQRAKTEIIKSHRDNLITLNMPLYPNISLAHTVEVDATLSQIGGNITAIGKVKQIQHSINVNNLRFSTTRIVIANSTAQGSTTATSLVIPTKPTFSYSPPAAAIAMGSVYGVVPPSGFAGFVGNRFIVQKSSYNGRATTDFSRTAFPETFTVKTPDIEDAVRNTGVQQVANSYNIAVPNSTLTVTY